MLEIVPILKVMWRRKVGSLLVIVQLALTMALISHAVFFIQQRAELIARPTGIDENIFSMTVRPISKNNDFYAIIQDDLTLIRSLLGVLAAAPINYVPLSGGGTSGSLRKDIESDKNDATYNLFFIDEFGIDALGSQLIEGRNFTADDVIVYRKEGYAMNSTIIITKQLADELFPGESAVGQIVYMGETDALKIVGVIEKNLGSWIRWKNSGNVVYAPVVKLKRDVITYIINPEKGEQQRLMREIPEKLNALNDDRLIGNVTTFKAMKEKSYQKDYRMIKVLSLVFVLLVFINAVGIIGLSNFLINQRRRQIGTRRALGATKSLILRYFLVENSLLCIIATVIGGLLAIIASDVLVREYALQPLPWYYLPIAALTLHLVTGLATYFPAYRATLISPALSTRSV